MLNSLINKLSGNTVKTVIDGAGKAASNLLDRFVPKKMSEAEKWGKVKDMMDFELSNGRLEIQDVNKARDRQKNIFNEFESCDPVISSLDEQYSTDKPAT